ncbi:uncharacterized protein LOC121854077 [Homarus americanus]|uniref:Uncharacterized protein n=1 Tax=Homarus americanus TaxID=6706 RepID=A0A8J5NAT0_HOMAM|nr:uncharacterized protein LOC121854077 [Homarus americanus]KAG7176079.1 hypothetical protein Hamer_G017054 [Homarus americanus]
MKTCESSQENDALLEVILYALMGINSTAGHGVQDPGELQATLLSILRDLLLESGTPPPPALERLVSRTNRSLQRRQRRRQREAQRQQLQLREGSTDTPDHAAGTTSGHSYSDTRLHESPLHHPAHAAHHLTRLIAVAPDIHLSQLASYRRPSHLRQVVSSTSVSEEQTRRRRQHLQEEQRQRCPSETCPETGNEE